MQKITLRPTCYYQSKKSKSEVFHLIEKKLQTCPDPIEGITIQDYAFIRIKKDLQHYWSPELQITVKEHEGQYMIRAQYGPKPVVWSMFMFFYGLVLAISFFGSVTGIIQWYLNIPAHFLWFIPGGISGILMIYGAALFGQYKGSEQKKMLKAFAMNIIDEHS